MMASKRRLFSLILCVCPYCSHFQMTVDSNYAIATATLIISRQFFHQQAKKQNQNQSHLLRAIFPALLSKLHVITTNSDWLITPFAPVTIGRSNNFGIGSSTVMRKSLLKYSTLIPLSGKTYSPLSLKRK